MENTVEAARIADAADGIVERASAADSSLFFASEPDTQKRVPIRGCRPGNMGVFPGDFRIPAPPAK